MDILKMLAFYHILPAIIGSAFTLFIVLFFMKIFFIRRPSLRHMFLFAPLIKPFTMLVGGFYIPRMDEVEWSRPNFQPGIQIPDPMNLVASSADKYSPYRLSDNTLLKPGVTELFMNFLLVAAILFLVMLAIRWGALYAYRQRLAASEEMDHAIYPKVSAIAERLSKSFNVKMPRIVFADVPCPLMIGFANCTIALPAGGIDKLSEAELEAVLAHEFAHIKRKDNIKLWVAITLRDLLFFSPFVWITFRLLSAERERSADYLAAKTTGKPVELAGAIAKVAEISSGFTMPQPALGIVKSDLAPKLSVTHRVNELLNFKLRRRIILRALPLTILFLMLFYVRFLVHLRLPGNQIFGFFG